MKKTILCGALITLIGTVQADASPKAAAVTTTPAPVTTAATTVAPQAAAPSTQPQTSAIMDCDYKIPADTKKIESSIVTAWAEKATMQSFNFNADAIDSQLQKLRACFTDQGWEGFNSALQKSGNIEAIKSQKLNVNSKVDGQVQATETKENQWDVTLPLQVVYQNDKEKLTQLLQINLSLGRKVNGDLGIIKIIASARKETPAATPTAVNAPQTTPTIAPTQPTDATKNSTTPK